MMKTILCAIAAASVAVVSPAWAQTMGSPNWGGWHDRWMWWMPFQGLLSLVVIAAVVVGAILLIRALWHVGERRDRSERSSALDLLDARYARGEIDREEYQQRRRDLSER